MKKLIGFIAVIILVVLVFIFVINKEKDYKVEYEYKDYNISEEYHKKDKIYSFSIKKKDINFYYVYESEYSNKRKLVTEFKLDKDEDLICGTLTVLDKILPTQCYHEYKYIDESFIRNNGDPKKLITKSGNVEIYNDEYDYYIWNNKGITNVKSNEVLSFLVKESYTNILSYQLDNYIIFADYDSQRTFNKFYIFDREKNKTSEWKLKQDIYLDSYFMGDYDGYIYLFDRKDKIEYKLDIKKKKITKVSNKDGGIVYQDDWEDIPLEKLVYTDYLFKDTKAYNYSVLDNQLYLTLYKSDYKISVFEGEVTAIIKTVGDKVYFLSGDSLYSFDLENGSRLLLKSFEWNFSYENKLFIFE